jgi:hypothetical protein
MLVMTMMPTPCLCRYNNMSIRVLVEGLGLFVPLPPLCRPRFKLPNESFACTLLFCIDFDARTIQFHELFVVNSAKRRRVLKVETVFRSIGSLCLSAATIKKA